MRGLFAIACSDEIVHMFRPCCPLNSNDVANLIPLGAEKWSASAGTGGRLGSEHTDGIHRNR